MAGWPALVIRCDVSGGRAGLIPMHASSSTAMGHGCAVVLAWSGSPKARRSSPDSCFAGRGQPGDGMVVCRDRVTVVRD